MQKQAQEEQLRATEKAHAEMRTQDMLAMLALIIAVRQRETIASDLELMVWRLFAFILLLIGASPRARSSARFDRQHTQRWRLNKVLIYEDQVTVTTESDGHLNAR